MWNSELELTKQTDPKKSKLKNHHSSLFTQFSSLITHFLSPNNDKIYHSARLAPKTQLCFHPKKLKKIGTHTLWPLSSSFLLTEIQPTPDQSVLPLSPSRTSPLVTFVKTQTRRSCCHRSSQCPRLSDIWDLLCRMDRSGKGKGRIREVRPWMRCEIGEEEVRPWRVRCGWCCSEEMY